MQTAVPYAEFQAAMVVLGYRTSTARVKGSAAFARQYRKTGIPAEVKAAALSFVKRTGKTTLYGPNTELKAVKTAVVKAVNRATSTRLASTRKATRTKAEQVVETSGLTRAQIAEIVQIVMAVKASS